MDWWMRRLYRQLLLEVDAFGARKPFSQRQVTPGYAGGNEPNPSYRQVASGATGHAEVVKLEFDPARVSLGGLLDLFFASHDPASVDAQGPDRGRCYRSLVLYGGPDQRAEAEAAARRAQESLSEERVLGLFPTGRRVATELGPLGDFYPAEAAHRDFYRRNQLLPYSLMHIAPKLASGKVRAVINRLNRPPADSR